MLYDSVLVAVGEDYLGLSLHVLSSSANNRPHMDYIIYSGKGLTGIQLLNVDFAIKLN